MPANEKVMMHKLMWEKCECLFQGSSVPKATIIRGIEQRMYEVRKNWQSRSKDKGMSGLLSGS